MIQGVSFTDQEKIMFEKLFKIFLQRKQTGQNLTKEDVTSIIGSDKETYLKYGKYQGLRVQALSIRQKENRVAQLNEQARNNAIEREILKADLETRKVATAKAEEELAQQLQKITIEKEKLAKLHNECVELEKTKLAYETHVQTLENGLTTLYTQVQKSENAINEARATAVKNIAYEVRRIDLGK